MATEWYMGAPWYDKALEAAKRKGLIGTIARIARLYRDSDPTLAYVAMPAYNGAIRVQVGEHGVILSQPDHVIIGFSVDAPHVDAPTTGRRGPSKSTKSARTTKARKATVRGPRDRAELRAWLEEAGYTLELSQGGHYALLDPRGRRVVTLTATASDHRTHRNEVAELRRVTGLPLRKESR